MSSPTGRDVRWSGRTHAGVVVEAFSRFSHREAFIAGSRRVTYAEAADLTSQIEQVLASLGVREGSGIGVLSPNVPEAYLVHVATGLLRARHCGLHPLGSVEDHAFACDDGELEVLVTHPDHAETAAAVAARSGAVRHVLTIGHSESGQDLLRLCERYTPKRLSAAGVRPDDVAWMPYTGGTTGRPKAVVIPQRAFAQEVLSLTCSWGLPQRPRFLAATPITHAALLPMAPVLARGGTVVLHRRFEPEHWLRTITKEKIDFTFAVPTMLYSLLDGVDVAAADTSPLKTLAYGAAPTTPARLAEAVDAFGPVMLQVYGQTECAGMITTLLHEEHVGRSRLLASCGRPVAGVVVDLLDDNGDPVGEGEVGELCTRSAVVMDGYWKRPAETAHALRGGWLHTGDMAARDEEGFLHIVDRQKDVIITGGLNVYPREIEDVLADVPAVSASAVVGAPDNKWGEAVTAFVVPKPGMTVDVDEVRAIVRTRKGPHQVPKRIEVVDSLPVTAVGKVDKKLLRARFADPAAATPEPPSALPGGNTTR